MKNGDVFVMEKKRLEELLDGHPLFDDVRQGKAHARKLVEGGEEAVGQVVLRIERIGSAKPRRPAFDCDFGDED